MVLRRVCGWVLAVAGGCAPAEGVPRLQPDAGHEGAAGAGAAGGGGAGTGTGGTGGLAASGGTGGSRLPPFQGDPWALTDLWEPVPDDHGLGLHQARLWDRDDPFTPRPWTSCGVGCEWAPADPPDLPPRPDGMWPGADSGAPNSLVGDDLYARLRVGTVVAGATGIETFVATVRLRDARTVAMIRTKLSISGGLRNSALLFPVRDGGDPASSLRTLRIRLGADGLADGPGVWWGWLPALSGTVGDTYDWEHGWGFAANERILTVERPADTAFRVLTPESVNVFEVMAQGDQLVGPGSALRLYDTLYSYTRETGMVALYTAPADHFIRSTAVGARWIAWVIATPYRDGSRFDRAWICWAPRVRRSEELVVTLGPEIAGAEVISHQLFVGIDHVAVLHDTNWSHHVWNVATGQQWVLPIARDGSWRELLGLDATYLYFKAWEPNFPTPQLFQRLVRWRLDQLDALEAASQTW